ncbi:DUF2157 domain-containing protein [Sphaerisporangium sp. NPDC088356]|uniref:DUF2157 domain-containing protein n=1 Tax=Sphaerisporangium sp. NPDC088356 TaxID=3154871 RepID=UPI00343545C3
MESIRQVPARRLAWLHGELAQWQAEGVIDADTARRIGGRYAVGRRLSLERLVLVLGGGFLGVGLIWLVSANLDQLSPLARLAGIALALWSGLAVAAVVAGAAIVFGDVDGRREVLAVGLMIGLALLLVMWSPGGDYGYTGTFTAGQTARAVAGTLVYILAASWFAVVAARRDLSYLVFLATAALVVFVTAQSFAVFQSLFAGAALFLVLGVVFILTGTLVFYGRRRLMEATR